MRFEEGDLVVWDDDQKTEKRKKVLPGLKRDFGEGPFEVVEVREVEESEAPHPQMVYVRFEGQLVSSSFPGDWFKPYLSP